MKSTSLPLILGIIVVLLVGGLVYMQTSKSKIPTTPTTQQTGGTQSQGTSGSYSMAEVATHKDATSCWTVIDGTVYDLTQWIDQHPGGPEAIQSICGIDGSSAFHGQHGNNPRQENILATFKIGTLTQ